MAKGEIFAEHWRSEVLTGHITFCLAFFCHKLGSHLFTYFNECQWAQHRANNETNFGRDIFFDEDEVAQAFCLCGQPKREALQFICQMDDFGVNHLCLLAIGTIGLLITCIPILALAGLSQQ